MITFFSLFHSSNADLLILGVTVAAIVILGGVIYFNNTKGATSRTFLLLALVNTGYVVVNYLSYHTTSPGLVLFLLRLVMFFSVWYSLVLFCLVYIFPKNDAGALPQNIKYFLIPAVAAVSILTLTPLVFSKISSQIVLGQVANPDRGPAIALFGITIMGLVVGSIYLLGKKTFSATGQEKRQLQLVWFGTLLTYTLILVFNFILPVIFNALQFIPFAPLFTLFFIIFTAYAIIKYHLLNIKVITTEILTFTLAVGVLFEVFTSNSPVAIFFNFCLFLLILSLGILLIKSVINEVKQREQLEALTKQLEDANEKLKTLDTARAEFITIASHQLRTPPATIKWFLASLLSGDYGAMTDEQKDVLEKTTRTNNSQISLIDDMLNVSRIERGKMEFLFEPADLLDLANLTFEQLEPMAKEKGLELMFDRPETKPPIILADKEKIRQVMNNLIDNAIKYTKAGAVMVSLSATPEEIRFSVKDTGKGISPEEQKTIFEKFSRGKESIKQSAGLGLGLYVAKVVVEQHKGKIWAESPGEGQGSSFIFTLPINSGLQTTTLVDFTAGATNQPAPK
jgi:signal transduction histidine kinase